jgi:hypothetical protein
MLGRGNQIVNADFKIDYADYADYADYILKKPVGFYTHRLFQTIVP